MKSKVDPATLDPVRRRLVERADELGVTWDGLSRRVGRAPGYIFDFIKGKNKKGSPRELPGAIRAKVADILGMDEDELRHRPRPARLARPASAVESAGDLIPVYRDTGLIAPNAAAESVPRPAVLPPNARGYGVWVSRDDGRLRAGDILVCYPSRPARPGDLVVIQRDDRIAVMGELRAAEPDGWQIETGGSITSVGTEGTELAKVVATLHA